MTPMQARDASTLQQGSIATEFLETLATLRTSLCVTTLSGDDLTLREAFARGLEALMACARAGRKLMFIGNGGSAAIASHQAVDYLKNGGFEAVAFNDPSLLTCMGNDFGYAEVFAEPIRRYAKHGDVLIAVSSSGQSPNIVNGASAARETGCGLLTFSGFDDTNPLRRMGELNFYVPSHNYGIVEVMHLTLLHAMLDEAIARRLRVECAG